MMTAAEKIKIILGRKNISISDLASMLGYSQPNLSSKLIRDNFSEKELRLIADVLNYDLDILFIDKETKEPL